MLATGWSPDYCMDSLTPRAVGFLLETQARREARELLQLVSVVHGDPKEVHARLADVAFPKPPAVKNFTESLASMAEALGQQKVAVQIRQRDRALRVLAKIKGGASA